MTRALAALVLAACAAPLPRTQVMVIVDAEPGVRAEAVAARVTVTGGTAAPTMVRHEETVGGPGSPIQFPIRLAVVPAEDDAARVFAVQVEALGRTGLRAASVRAESGFLEGRTLELRLLLEDCCLAMDCGPQTCRGCACADPRVPPETLPELVADAGAAPDAGPRDAGAGDAGPRDASFDGASAEDAGPHDAGPLDAGPGDAGARDGGADPRDAGAGCAGRADGSSCGPTTQRCCGGACVDVATDALHCGACNDPCEAARPFCADRVCVECRDAADCDDFVDCTDDRCAAGLGTCVHELDSTRCPIGTVCEGAPLCTGSGCGFEGAPNGVPCGGGDICACFMCMDPDELCVPCDATSACEQEACRVAGRCP